MTIYDTPGERFQAQFQVLMSEARLLVNEYEAAFTKKFPDEYVKGDSFPEATVVRLMLGTIPIFEAAVACLNEPGTSRSAPTP